MQFCSLPMLALPDISATMGSVVLLLGIWVSPSITWGPAGVPHPLLTSSAHIFLLSSLLCRAPWAGGDITSFSLAALTYPSVERQLMHSQEWADQAHPLCRALAATIPKCFPCSLALFMCSPFPKAWDCPTGPPWIKKFGWFVCWPFLNLFFKFLHAMISIVIEYK